MAVQLVRDTLEHLLSAKELAARLGVAEQTIYNRNSSGGALPPAVKLGRLLRFRASDVEAWLQALSDSRQPTKPLLSAREPRLGAGKTP